MTKHEARAELDELPVDVEDQAMVNTAVYTGDWSAVVKWLHYRMRAGKNYTRTLKVARAWRWHNGSKVCNEFYEEIIAWIAETR